MDALTRLKTSVSKANIVLATKVGERVGRIVGRIVERFPAIARHYDTHLVLDAEGKKVTQVTWGKKESRDERATLTGCYVIETSHRHLEAKEVWDLYTTLTRVEDAFRALKSELGIRPIYHQLAGRTQAHLFVSAGSRPRCCYWRAHPSLPGDCFAPQTGCGPFQKQQTPFFVSCGQE
ncbi:MAG: hypothetical protein ACYCVB_05025 [Bacilli bacterium]